MKLSKLFSNVTVPKVPSRRLTSLLAFQLTATKINSMKPPAKILMPGKTNSSDSIMIDNIVEAPTNVRVIN